MASKMFACSWTIWTVVLLPLRGISDETPEGHLVEIPQVLEVIEAVGKDTEPGVVSAKQKEEHGGIIVTLCSNLVNGLTWISWTKIAHSYIRGGFCVSRMVFEIETLSSNTFLVPSMGLGGNERGDRGAARTEL
ncbi:hypothetical protein DFJ43DRAFT_1141238 [Lentinula guzmanii]|uniref:Uncharacterized protein n=1 Tax=Lentinula guzmanii TaxID=2804957 RepID=A0AA38J4L7_9AGAR|nr:hypothetical protein DFJ43DRAFT_1141238 [Lentinula guzmanii]